MAAVQAEDVRASFLFVGELNQNIYNNRYTQREFKLKLSAIVKACDIKYTENSKN